MFELFFKLFLGEGREISHSFLISSCETTPQTFVCQEKNFVEYSEEIVLVLTTQSKNHTLDTCIFMKVNVIMFCFVYQKIGFVFRFCVRRRLGLWQRNG